LRTDPSEKINLIDDQPEIAKALKHDLEKLLRTGLAGLTNNEFE